MSDFRFASPSVLWGLLIVPAFYFLLIVLEKQSKHHLEKFVKMPLWKSVRPEYFPSASGRKRLLWCASLFFVLLSVARPQWGKVEEEIPTTGLDILFVLDVSQSMDVEDLTPSRLEVVKRWIQTFAKRVEGDRMGLVLFAGSSYLSSPLTTDASYIESIVAEVSTRAISNQGTDIGLGLEMALKTLDRGAVESLPPASGNSGGLGGQGIAQTDNNRPVASQVVVLISDGEDHEPGATKAAEKMRSLGIQFFALGVGTEKGGPVPLKDLDGKNVGFKRDKSGNVVVSTFHPNSLQEISKSAGGTYFNLTTSQTEISQMFQALNSLQRGELQTRKLVFYQERYQWPLFMAFLLLCLELSIRKRRKQSLPELSKPTVTSVASAIVLLWVPFFLSYLLGVRSSFANSYQEPRQRSTNKVEDPGLLQSYRAYLENQEGVKHFKKGKLDDAQYHFGQAQGYQPDSATLLFNQGVVEAKKGAIDRSIPAFEKSAQEAKKLGNTHLEAQSHFNLGNALGSNQKKKEAIEAYLRSIELAKKTEDKDLLQAAKRNLELLTSQPPQQQQSQQNQSGDQNQQKQNSPSSNSGKNDSDDPQQGDQSKPDQPNQKDKKQNSESEQDQKNPQNKDQNQNQKSQEQNKEESNGNQNQEAPEENEGNSNQQSKKDSQSKNRSNQRQFRSEKLTKEDAERIMQDISNREQQVRERIKQRRNRNGKEDRKDGGPDW